MNVVIYTANIDSYDRYHSTVVSDKNVKCIYFCNDKDAGVRLKGWDVKQVHKDKEFKGWSATKIARYYKLHPHLVLPSHDVSIWVDARFVVHCRNVRRYMRNHFDREDYVACYYHPRKLMDDNCSYKEAFVVGTLNKEKTNVLLKQIQKYKSDNFPENYGLFATGIMIRRNNDQVNKFNEFWWNEICEGSVRDQISQVYSAWKTGVKITPIDGDVYNNRLVKRTNHVKK